jgi:hypothetical protein
LEQKKDLGNAPVEKTGPVQKTGPLAGPSKDQKKNGEKQACCSLF